MVDPTLQAGFENDPTCPPDSHNVAEIIKELLAAEQRNDPHMFVLTERIASLVAKVKALQTNYQRHLEEDCHPRTIIINEDNRLQQRIDAAVTVLRKAQTTGVSDQYSLMADVLAALGADTKE